MSELWYRGYKTIGVPKDVAFRITNEIKRVNIGNYMPRICLEPSNKRSEFYFFIGINSERTGELPTEVQEFERWLAIQRIRVFSGGECVLHDDLTKSWLKRELDITYTRQLMRWNFQAEIHLSDNPFDLSKDSMPDLTAQQSYNRILYWLSTQGDGSWQNYRNACDELKIVKSLEPSHLFRRLRLLGHSEYLDRGNRWTICPACFVQLESSDDRYQCFLAGGRSPAILDVLSNIRLQSQASRGAPDAIFISFEAFAEAQSVISEVFQRTGCSIKLAGKASTKLTDLLPNLKGWQETLLTKITIIPDRYKIHKWDGDDFSQWVDQPKEFGMYRLVESRPGENASDYYFFYNPEHNQWYQGDWYGLRYLANWYLHNLPILKHNMAEKLLFIPHPHHVPDIYEKALVLASGELPVSNNIGIVYKNISFDLATLIAIKLDIEIERN